VALYGRPGHQITVPSFHDWPLVGDDLDRCHGDDVGVPVVTYLRYQPRKLPPLLRGWFCGVGLDECPDFG